MDTGTLDTTLKVYRAVPDLEGLRSLWSSRKTAPTGDLDFYLSVICSPPEFIRPHVIVIYKSGQPISLLVGRLERRSMAIRLGYLRVPMPNIKILIFDDCGWFGGISANDSELYVRNVLTALRAGEADAAELQHLDPASPLSEVARSLPGRLFSDRSPIEQVLWIRRFAQKGRFLESLSKKTRYNQRRRTQVLSEEFAGAVRIECFHDGGRIDQLMQDAEAIAGKSYQRGLGVGFVNDDRMRDRLSLAAQQGALHAHVLYLGDTPSAFWIATLSGGVLYSDFLAFDPAFAKFGPGLYLLIKVIEEICDSDSNRRATAVDFGPGDSEYKRLLSNERQQLTSFYIFAPTIKGAMLNLVRMAVSSTDRLIKAILERAGFLSRVKRTWRGDMARPDGPESKRGIGCDDPLRYSVSSYWNLMKFLVELGRRGVWRIRARRNARARRPPRLRTAPMARITPELRPAGAGPTVFYLCPDDDRPSGGIRMIYRHVDALNSAGTPAVVIHHRRGFACSWFEHQTPIASSRAAILTPQDVLVVPEFYGPGLHELPVGPRIVIFNQGAYLTFVGVRSTLPGAPYRDVPGIEAILVVWHDSAEYLRYGFSELRVERVRNAVDGRMFYPSATSPGRRVAVMPRQRAMANCEQVLHLLRARGCLSSWEVVNIDGCSERETVG